MLTRLVLLLSVLNFVCESVSLAESIRIPCGSPDSPNSSSNRVTRASSASSAESQRSPLVEIMLRILDTIQVVPKKRPRRNVTGQKQQNNTWLSKVAAVRMVVVTSPEQSEELDKAPLFSGSGINQPLMESSLEQTIHDADQHLSEEYDSHQQQQYQSIEDDFPDYPTSDSYEAIREETDEKIYDLLLKILQILDDQAHRDAERVRRLERLDDDYDDNHGGDLDDEIESD